jgi:hypothetical protein
MALLASGKPLSGRRVLAGPLVCHMSDADGTSCRTVVRGVSATLIPSRRLGLFFRSSLDSDRALGNERGDRTDGGSNGQQYSPGDADRDGKLD